jgi:hypothetical protein
VVEAMETAVVEGCAVVDGTVFKGGDIFRSVSHQERF